MQLMILLCPGSLHASKMVLVCGVVLYMNALPMIDLGAEAAARRTIEAPACRRGRVDDLHGTGGTETKFAFAAALRAPSKPRSTLSHKLHS